IVPTLTRLPPIQSPPYPPPAVRLQSSTPSTARFAQSIASRASRSGSAFSSSAGSSSKVSQPTSTQRTDISFDEISAIPPYPPPSRVALGEAEINEDGFDEDLSLAEALQPLSHTGSPFPPEEDGHSNSLKYNYSVSLRSEPKPSPFDKMRNVSFRKPIQRTRTPSLTRTLSSSSSPSNSTPHSSRSPGPTHPNDGPSLTDSDGEPTSPDDLPLPNDTSGSRDLEQDLEQALAGNDDHTAPEESAPASSVADSDELPDDPVLPFPRRSRHPTLTLTLLLLPQSPSCLIAQIRCPFPQSQ
ncbi:hypothetical protein EI94DRAFT_1810185, partial [Lactarius quietus]